MGKQVRTTTQSVVDTSDKAAIDAKLAAQNADFAETKVQEAQLALDKSEKEAKDAADNLARQEENQKTVAEMQEQDAGQEAAEIIAPPQDDDAQAPAQDADADATASDPEASIELLEIHATDDLYDLS